MSGTTPLVFFPVAKEKPVYTGSKVSIVGAGDVGMACAFAILQQSLSAHIALLDVDARKVAGEVLDLQHGLAFLPSHVEIGGGSDVGVTRGSRLVVVTAGARQRDGESRLALLRRNVHIFKSLIPPLVEASPGAVLLIVSNPVDVLTWAAWKLSGLPAGRVLGAGTNLDSGRLRFLLGQKLGIAASSCHGWILGEHGDASVAVWDSVNVAGVPLAKQVPGVGDEDWESLHKTVVQSAYSIIGLKGHTNWAIGLSVAQLAKSILRDTGNLHAVSVDVKGFHGVKDSVFLSLPCSLGAQGVRAVVRQRFGTEEERKFVHSADELRNLQDELNI